MAEGKKLSQDGNIIWVNKKNGFIAVVCEISGDVCDVTTVLVRAGLQFVHLQ
jgi:hypothetical protein